MRTTLRDLKLMCDTARYCRRAKEANGRRGAAVFRNAVQMCRERRFEPSEAYYLGLFDGDFDPSTLDRYVSRRELTKLQERVNPPSWADLLKNKGMFYRFCMANDIPAPRLYALFFRENGGLVTGGRWLGANGEAWRQFLDEELPETFVLKPARGSNGDGVFIIERRGAAFRDAAGCEYDAGGMWRLMSSDVFATGLIVQERLQNHEALIRLTGSEFLQTVRACTFVDTTGRARLLHAHLKLTARGVAVDNFGVGAGGNLQCCINLDSGVPDAAVRLRSCGNGLELVDRHPETDLAFNAFVLPQWPQFREMVNRAAQRFLPVRAIGWDVAITPAGPMVVEGNIWWGPNNPHRNMDKVREALASDDAGPAAAAPQKDPGA
ncbi:MAG: hypothetical protein IH624_16925 [Phycisphaerae bacterium]|nr:hypothetical protein [Phycisphaerae bacterium]